MKSEFDGFVSRFKVKRTLAICPFCKHKEERVEVERASRVEKLYPHISQINFLRPSLVVQVARLLHLAQINPIVQSHHGAVLHLWQEDVLEARRANLSTAARIQIEPDGFQQLTVRRWIGGHDSFLGQEAHGVPAMNQSRSLNASGVRKNSLLKISSVYKILKKRQFKSRHKNLTFAINRQFETRHVKSQKLSIG